MSNRSAYKLLLVLILVAVPYELVLNFGPAADESLAGMWQFWHPYFVPLLGFTLVPIMFGYVFPLARRLGGRATAWGRAIWFLAAGVISYTIIGTGITFYDLTCAKWGALSCDNPAGYLPHPSWNAIGFLLMYPLVAVGLIAMLRALGTSARQELVQRWYIPFITTLLVAIYALPFGLDRAFDPRQTTVGTIVDAATLLGCIATVTLAGLAAANTSQLAGGSLRTPVYLQLVGIVGIGIGALLAVHTNVAGQQFSSRDFVAIPFTLGFVAWIASFLMIGATLERMLGVAESPEPVAQAV